MAQDHAMTCTVEQKQLALEGDMYAKNMHISVSTCFLNVLLREYDHT
jgi:hypothetical protein